MHMAGPVVMVPCSPHVNNIPDACICLVLVVGMCFLTHNEVSPHSFFVDHVFQPQNLPQRPPTTKGHKNNCTDNILHILVKAQPSTRSIGPPSCSPFPFFPVTLFSSSFLLFSLLLPLLPLTLFTPSFRLFLQQYPYFLH